jgi:XrtN system VIT domain protein
LLLCAFAGKNILFSRPLVVKNGKIKIYFVLQSAFYLIVLPDIQNLYMEVGISKWRSTSFNIGLALLCLSLTTFLFSGYQASEEKRAICFLFNHLVVLGWFFANWMMGNLKRNPNRRHVTAIFVILLLLDAYTVNNVLSVVESSVPWFAIILVLICANILAFCFFEQLPEWARCLQSAILGFTLLAPVYLAIYLLNMYVISLVGLIAIGLSVITFSPLFLLWFNLRMVQQLIWQVFRYRIIYLVTLAASVGIIIIYALLYAINIKAIDDIWYEDHREGELFAWVRVAQEMPDGPMAERIMKTNIVYMAPQQLHDFGLWSVPRREYDSELKHDPLFMMSAFVFGTTIIPEEDRLNILNVIYDKRHFAEDRFWSGKDLVTTKVSTTADLWPRYHMAYTENTITVANQSRKRWPENGEAIYTFHLPEGGVVTSLSLWINGKEEKGVLTTKQKAQAAYADIVGVQYRDPSVVHWQEGNRVVIRVFPVPLQKERKFKIGITSPLIVHAGKMVYQPAWFEGPPHDNADYEVQLNMDTWPKEVVYPSGFHPGAKNTLTRKGGYDANWELTMPVATIDNAAFSFNGQHYTLLSYTPAHEFFTPENYYLDINSYWHYSDYQQIIAQLKGKQVWIFHPLKGMIALTEKNKAALFEELQQFRFSLFPFHHISDHNSALVITASGNVSPQLADLKDSQFQDSLHHFFKNRQVRLYDIGSALSPYLATLKESRSLIYEKGTIEQLLSQLNKNSFLKPEEDSSQLIMADAGMRIARSTDSSLAQGPDHLARLFVYNYVLKELGQQVSASDSGNVSTLVAAAKEAYIVSPLSSLIVLETKADYDKYDIKDEGNTLKNAALKGHGTVPEPHEWVLFMIAVLLLMYAWTEKWLFRKKENIC